MSAGFSLSPAAKQSDRPVHNSEAEKLAIDCMHRSQRINHLHRTKVRAAKHASLMQDSAAKGVVHPSGPKFTNTWLWKHYKLSPHFDCDKWGLCIVCQKAGEITWLPHVDGSTTRMKKHLLDAHNMYAPQCMHDTYMPCYHIIVL